jgi:hypothetical protein
MVPLADGAGASVPADSALADSALGLGSFIPTQWWPGVCW